MKEGELTDFLYLIFVLGIVLLVYSPSLVKLALPLVTILGAFYLVVGVLARITHAFFGIGRSRMEDWFNGVAILAIVAIVFGQKELVLNTLYAFFSLIFYMVSGLLGL